MAFEGNFPRAGKSNFIKRIQRGAASGSGDVSITPVNPSKTEVRSFSQGSAGYVAVRGTLDIVPASGQTSYTYVSGNEYLMTSALPNYSGSLSGGTTDITVAAYGAALKDTATITCTGPCAWEVIEYV